MKAPNAVCTPRVSAESTRAEEEDDEGGDKVAVCVVMVRVSVLPVTDGAPGARR